MADAADAGVETNLEEGSDLEDTGVEAGEEVSSASSEDGTDWKAVAEAERLRAENYKTALGQKRQLRNKPLQPVVEDEEGDDDDKPLTRKDLRKAFQEDVLPVVTQSKVDTILAESVKDPAKREAVKLFYETRIRQTGTSDEAIRSDIEAAIAIANGARLRKSAAEMSRVEGRDTTPPLSGTESDRAPAAKNHKFSEAQVKALEAKAKVLGIDPKKFVDEAWKNQRA